jgi:hypothetical protein
MMDHWYEDVFNEVSELHPLESTAVGVGSGTLGACAAGMAKIGLGKAALTGLALASVVAAPFTAGVTIGVLAGVMHASNACRNRGRLANNRV